MVTNLRVPPGPSAAARDRAQEYLNQAGENAADSVNAVESCVRDHPESAVWTAFLTGLVVGVAAGWLSAQRQHRHWFDEIEDFAGKLRGRLHW